MHLYVIMRGIKDRQERVVNDLLARYYTYKAGEINGKPVMSSVQLSVRPIQLFEIVFPEEVANQVIGAIQPYGGYGLQEGFMKKIIKLARKILKVEDIPPNLPKTDFLNTDGVDIFGIGIKRDKQIPVTREDL